MKNKQWYLLVIVLLLGAFALSACGGSEPEATEEQAAEEPAAEEPAAEEPAAEEPAAEEPAAEEAMGEGSIAVLLPDSASSARWEADDRRFFEEAFDAAGVEYSIVNAEGDARTQQTQAEQAITNGAKVLLLVNLDSGSGAAIIAQARDAGVKVIDYDRLTIEGPGADVYVSFDNVSVGRLMGETLEPIIDALDVDVPQVVQLNGSPTDNNATLFREGYYSIAKPHYDDGSWELVDDQAVPDWDNQQALVIFEQILTAAGGNVDAVFAANDGLANSVISALKSQGIDAVPVSGQDATVAGIQNILAGDQTMTVYKPIKLEAEAAAEAAIALLNGEDVSALTSDTLNNGTNDVPFMKLTPIAVTKDNIEETVIADGFRTWEEVCVGDFEALCESAQNGEEETAAETTATLRIWADENRIPVLESLKDTVAETIGVELVLEQVALGDMAEQVRIAIPAGEGPDIFIAPHDQIGSYIEGGLISPIDLGDKADGFVPSSLEAFTYNSELYGMPYATENVAFFRNVDLVPEPVETFDDMVAVCNDLMAEGTVENCTVFPNTNYHIYGLHTAFGGYIFGQDADGNYLPEDVGLDSPGFIASGEFIQQLVEDGLVPATADGQTADALFGEGKLPFVLNGPWALNGYREAGVNFSVDPIPAGDAGPGAPFLGVQGFVVNALSEQQLLAQAFLTELVATDEIMQAFQDQDPRIPAWKTTLDAVDDADLAGFGVIAPYASPMPNIPQMGAVWGSWGDAVQVIMNGEQTPEEALTNGAEQIREAIAQ